MTTCRSDYSYLIDGFTWSYSRLTSFDSCKYGFFLSYIKPEKKSRMFFSDYGLFIHKILEMYYSKELKSDQLLNYFLLNFSSHVNGTPPSEQVFDNYLRQGVEFFKNFEPENETILGVEKKFEFSIPSNSGTKKFVGVVDKVSEKDGKLIVTDHKSHKLSPRSTSQSPTKTDAELDKYLRQLYLYSIPVKDKYGRFPDFLSFNCFRTQTVITEPFVIEDFERAVAWALDTIDSIRAERDWNPHVELFKCKYVCDCHENCEYYRMMIG